MKDKEIRVCEFCKKEIEKHCKCWRNRIHWFMRMKNFFKTIADQVLIAHLKGLAIDTKDLEEQLLATKRITRL